MPDWLKVALVLAGMLGLLAVFVAWLETRGSFGVDPDDEED